jgi:hypothetical protein
MGWQRKQARGLAVLATLALLLGLLAPSLAPALQRLDGPGAMVCSAAGLMPAPMDPSPATSTPDCKSCLLQCQPWAPPPQHDIPVSPADACTHGRDEVRTAPRIGQWRRAQPHAP